MYCERELFTSLDGHLFVASTSEEPIEEGIGHYVDIVRRGIDTFSGRECIVLTCHRGDASRAKLAQWMFEMRFLKECPKFRSHMCAPLHVCFSDEHDEASAICAPGGRDVFETVVHALPDDEHVEIRRWFASQLVMFATRMLVELVEIDEVKLLSDLKPENILYFGGDPTSAIASEFRMIDFGVYDTMRTVCDEGGVVKLLPFTESYRHPQRKLNEYACTRDVLYTISKMYFTVSTLTMMEYDHVRSYVESIGTSFDHVMLDIYGRTLRAKNDDNLRDCCDRIAQIAVYMP